MDATAQPDTQSELRPRIRVAALIIEGDRVLLVEHAKGENRYWLLPGGGVDHGESLPEALRRELLEETGLEIAVGSLALVNDTIAPDRARHIVHITFHARITGGSLSVGVDPRLIGAAWVPLEELPGLSFYPAIQAEIAAAAQTDAAVYLGNIWVP